ncbi:glycosyltransferase family 2 protein [Geobacter sp. AOG2]|uniref:glycosyltransferase family 2 protein n=1 Tax=Geobacter sp. AOG2 TaxID=1566347 RepID=UPI001CC82DCA|nr:glycosyltransferase family 2 protein [Geobacter sp. AOG2]
MSSHNISAVLLVRNEEPNIRLCLEGLKWCDEIVVVDMESEDDTVAIAREFTDNIYSHERVIAFDIAKNYAVEKASNEWVLLIDADEMVPACLAAELRLIAEKDEVDAVYIAFKNFILGEWNRAKAWWPNYHCRFFKKQSMMISERIHAYMSVSNTARTLYLPPEEKFAIHHFAYRDAEQFISKLNRYTTIEAKHLYDDGKKFTYYLFFKSTIKEFIDRYIRLGGYKDGLRGFFVCIMMVMYRAVACIKLWELHENKDDIKHKYDKLKNNIIGGY